MKRTLLPRLAVLAAMAFSLPVYAQYSSPMRDVDNGARQPVNFSANLPVNNGSSGNTNTTAVNTPAGKRLVIETISSNGFVPSGEAGFVTISVTSGAGTAPGATSTTHAIPVVKLASTVGGDFIGGIGAFRAYAHVER